MNPEEILRAFREELARCADAEGLARIRARYAGRRGRLREAFSKLAKLAPEERRTAGRELNRCRQEIEEALRAREAALAAPDEPGEALDVTLPGTAPRLGGPHPIYRAMDEICSIFERMGFEVVYGPEIETEFNNFEALNMARDHPSRDPWDSFYIEREVLLRSHTSPVQIRVMKGRPPPLRVVAPGKVFRPDTADASHLPQFHQVEGLVVDEGIGFAHLKTTLDMWARAMYGEGIRTRFRPSYFPFTEPSAEMEIACVLCGGKGCQTCGGSGWLEILGAGMVHPRVFENVGIDPERYTGFAFGMGVERIAMLRYGVQDIRYFVENRMSFLEQFP